MFAASSAARSPGIWLWTIERVGVITAGMKSHRVELKFNIPARMDFVNITPEVVEAVRASGVKEGLCLVKAKRILPQKR